MSKRQSRRYLREQEGHLVEVQSNRPSKRKGRFARMIRAYNSMCLRCGAYGVPLTADHVIPFSRGGSNRMENIQPLCKSCNEAKGLSREDYRIFTHERSPYLYPHPGNWELFFRWISSGVDRARKRGAFIRLIQVRSAEGQQWRIRIERDPTKGDVTLCPQTPAWEDEV